ncbi:MAG TPA: M50 family metallopeptidase [Clostridiales bacterium]|nr:M50 family metallopeptidase [Clostridiales bacterium]
MFSFLVLSLASVWTKVWPILFAVVFFGLIIAVHELGHFLFAKLFKVRVNKFALGMGPAFLKFGKGETEYSLRILPIGGYCAMEGEDEESEDERSFSKKPVWQRFIIVAAGAIFNLILGLIIISVMLSQVELIGTNTVKTFTEDSVTQAAGFQEGDKIVKINGRRVFSDFDISFLIARSKGNKFDFTMKRQGKFVELNGVEMKTKEVNGHEFVVYDFIIKGLKPSVLNVPKYAFLQTVSVARVVWVSLLDLVTGRFGFKDISGPIGVVGVVAQVAGESSEGGVDLMPVLNLLSLISINIGLFNLLPVPALDGGRLFFMLIEIIRRKPVPQKYERWVHATGLLILLAFMAVISAADIVKLIRH